MVFVSRQTILLLAGITALGAAVGIVGLVDSTEDGEAERLAYMTGIAFAVYASIFLLGLERQRRRHVVAAQRGESEEIASTEHFRGSLVIQATRLTVRIRDVLADLKHLEGGDPQLDPRREFPGLYRYASDLVAEAERVAMSLLALEAEENALELVAVAEQLTILLPVADQETS